jgi:hypothetical protein
MSEDEAATRESPRAARRACGGARAEAGVRAFVARRHRLLEPLRLAREPA